MRLLNTQTGQFVWVGNPQRERYAILSHAWSKDPDEPEQTYHDILNIQEEVRVARAADPAIPIDEVLRRASPKIRNACRYALSDGLPLIWIDAPCIDKTSSAELSEAINSMYEWYRLSTVCYAFLHDVTEDPYTKPSSFRRSAWHTRGWTLQELIAPAIVIFLSSDWRILGGKHRLAYALEDATGIDSDVLTHSRPLSTVCVARRMFWASKRRTTRKEDEAYCLMGIFGVHIPIIYGEGPKAFLRLQEEILKHIPDQSIFVWYRAAPTKPHQGRMNVLPSLPDEHDHDSASSAISRITPISSSSISLITPIPSEPTEDTHEDTSHDRDALFASSPARFALSYDIRTIPKDVLAQKLGIPKLPPTTYIVTSEGMRVTFPLRSIAPAVDVAVLACEDRNGNLLGLILRQTKLAFVRSVGAPLNNHSFLDNSSSIITQHPSVYIRPISCTRPAKSISILRSIFSTRSVRTTEVQPTVAEVYIVHYRTPSTPLHPAFTLERLQADLSPFKIIPSRHLQSTGRVTNPYTCIFSEHPPSPVIDTFAQPSSAGNVSNLQPVGDPPSYTLQITGEPEWTFIAEFTRSQCTLGGAEAWASLAVKVTCIREGEVAREDDFPQRNCSVSEPGDTCVGHVHCWSGNNLWHLRDFSYPGADAWGPLIIRLYLYLEHPGSHTYPPTFSISTDVTVPQDLTRSPYVAEDVYAVMRMISTVLSNGSDDVGLESKSGIRYPLLWLRRISGLAIRYGKEGFRRISRTEGYPVRPQAPIPARNFGYNNLRDAFNQESPNPEHADCPAFEDEEQPEAPATPFTIRISIMDRVPFIALRSVNRMIEPGQPLSKGILATAIAREVLQFLERERAYGDPLRYGEREIQLEDLVLVDVERESPTVLVPMLALSIDDSNK